VAAVVLVNFYLDLVQLLVAVLVVAAFGVEQARVD